MLPKLSIIIPAYNEEKRLPPTLKKIDRYLKEKKILAEIIVINDGSTDNTEKIIKSINIMGLNVYSHYPNRGKGYAVKRGLEYSRGEKILITDADLSTPIEEYEKLNMELDKGYDFVIGSRGLTTSEILKPQKWYRQNMGKIFNLFVRTLLKIDFYDTQCGFKLIKGDVGRKIGKYMKIEGFAFDVELIIIARELGYKIKEIPVKWINDEDSKVHIIRDSTSMLIELFHIYLNKKRGIYHC